MEPIPPIHYEALALHARLLDAAYYSFKPLALLNFAAVLGVLYTAALIYRWDRGSRGSRYFAAFSGLFAIWATARGLMRLLDEPTLITLVARDSHAVIALVVPALYQFSCIFLRTEPRRMGLIRANYVVGIVMMLFSFSSPWVIDGVIRYPWGYEPQYGPMGPAVMTWVAGVIALGTYDWFRAFSGAMSNSKERRRIGWYGLALLCVYFTGVDMLAAAGLQVYPLGFLPVLVFVVLTGFITRRYGLVEISAELAAVEIANLTQGSLLIVDRDGLIKFVNDSAVKSLGHRREFLVGQLASAQLGEVFTPGHLAEIAAMDETGSEKKIQYSGLGGRARDFMLWVAVVRDSTGRDTGFLCMLRDVTEQQRQQQAQAADRLRDSLTGLVTRPLFIELLSNSLERKHAQADYNFAVCFLGLDRLRVVNEDLGYAVGDQVLIEIGNRLQRVTHGLGTVARLGGDEFGIVLRNVPSSEVVRHVVFKIEQAVRAPMSFGGHQFTVHASLGVADGVETYATGSDLLRSASMAMYQAKEAGGGTTRFVSAAELRSKRVQLESELRKAMEQREFLVLYQPVVDLVLKRVVGFEALVRWKHPQRGMVAPSEFIDFCGEVGLIAKLDRYVLEQACTDLARMHKETGNRELSISVNVSEQTLMDGNFYSYFSGRINASGLEPAHLRLELLERVANIEPIREVLERLHALGARIYIDDFGTGHSSLSRLTQLPVNTLKIDREFVQALQQNNSSAKIVGTIIALARNLELETIAEGASLPIEVVRLRKMGCRMIQGYYFSPPVAFETALALAWSPRALDDKFAPLLPHLTAPV